MKHKYIPLLTSLFSLLYWTWVIASPKEVLSGLGLIIAVLFGFSLAAYPLKLILDLLEKRISTS